MDGYEIIERIRKHLRTQLQGVGDALLDGVDNYEKYKYLVGQAHALQLTLQEISNLLNEKEQQNEDGTVIDLTKRDPKK